MLFVCGCLKGTIVALCVVFSIVVGMMGTSHNPFVWLRYPVSTCWLCLKTWTGFVAFLCDLCWWIVTLGDVFCDERWSEVWPGVEVSTFYCSEQC